MAQISVNNASYLAYGDCLLWKPWLVYVISTSGLLIFVTYGVLVVGTWLILRRRDDASLWRFAMVFMAIILLSGLTHLLQSVVIWKPVYDIQAWVKAIAALFSIVAVAVMFVLMPKVLALPTPNQFESLGAQLEAEIAAHHETIQALERAKERTEKANKAKSTLLANVSNELRAPLNAMLSSAQLLKSTPDATAMQIEKLDDIIRAGEYLSTVINKILDTSALEARCGQLEETDTDLNDMIKELQSIGEARAKEKDLKFIVRQPANIPTHIKIDSKKLHLALLGLLTNAFQYTKAGSVTLLIKVVKLDQLSARLRFEVIDTGVGIPENEIESIFKPPAQSKLTSTANSAVGLAVCRQYVALMGGELGVSSEVDRGSAFHIEIPVTVQAKNQRQVPRQASIIGVEEGQPRYRILITEDQEDNRKFLLKLLQPLGFELREAANGKEAVEIFRQWRPHLIWMDIRMEVMDGIEATQIIRQAEDGNHTKIIALTAHALEDKRLKILDTGCDDFVKKPFRNEDIYAALEKHLKVRYKYANRRLTDVKAH